MQQGGIKHVFPGGNTAEGFFSYYSHILGQEEAERIIVIKGGPGVGKSTFMKKIGNEMLQRGYNVEFMHCSSDNNSLDGVVIPDLKVAFIDGTAPHIVDPKSPGAVDEIINFGEFWNEEGIREHKKDIIRDTREIGRLFSRAYRYIKAAFSIYEDSTAINGWALRKGEFNSLAYEMINTLFPGKIAESEGKQRCLFASAITPDGFKNYLNSILTTEKVYEIRGGLGTGEEQLLEKLKAAALERGLDVEAYYCALNPHKLEHMVIPQLNISFTTSNSYHSSSVYKYAHIDMKQYIDENMISANKEDLYGNQEEFDKLMSVAVNCISRAKALHDKLETYYIPNINFDAIDECFEKTLSRILKV